MEARRSQGKKTPLAGRYRGLGALKAKVQVANMVDQEGIKPLLDGALRSCSGAYFTPVAGRWLEGPRERQRLGTEKALGWSVELVEGVRAKPPPKKCSDEVGGGIGQSAGKMVEVGTSFCQRGDFRSFHAAGWWNAHLPADWPQQEDEPSDYEKLCATSEAFVYTAMSCLMLRRLARF
jgi:hypothetical protein